MRLSELADRLQLFLPSETDLFSTQLDIVSIVSDGSTATIVTSTKHGLSDDEVVVLHGVETRTAIDSVSSVGFLHTFVTSSDHDLTEGNPDTATVPLTGFSDPAFNSDVELVDVPNRRTFTVRVAAGTPILNGDELLLEPNRLDGINGSHAITVVSNVSFTISGSFPIGSLTPFSGAVSARPRIGAAVDGARALEIFEQDADKFWCFVVPDAATVSKDRSTVSDAIATQQQGTTLRLKLLDNFSVLVFAPVSAQLAAEQAVDICRHDLLLPIVSSLFGYRPGSGLSCPESEFQIVPTGHQVEDYNKAVLVYAYSFQAPVDLTADDAKLDWLGSRAFRDADVDQVNRHTDVELAINLDEQPL